MHELGVIREAMKTVEAFAQENNIDVIDTIVLQIGELSGVIPDYVEQLFPAVVDGTKYRNVRLQIEVEEGIGVCRRVRGVALLAVLLVLSGVSLSLFFLFLF